MKDYKLRDLVEISLFSALIFISIAALHIEVGPQFIHFGNAMVVVGVLLFGSKKGALAATLGLGIFDLISGYAAVVWTTILESLLVCLLLHVIYERLMKRDDKPSNIITVGVIAAVAKVMMNLIKYTLIELIGGNLSLSASFLVALGKIVGSYGTAIATIVAVPIFYPILKEIAGKRKR